MPGWGLDRWPRLQGGALGRQGWECRRLHLELPWLLMEREVL